jgi:hypothetical protein
MKIEENGQNVLSLKSKNGQTDLKGMDKVSFGVKL